MSAEEPIAVSAEALLRAEQYVEEEEGAANRLKGWLGGFVRLTAFVMAAFHLYSAYAIVPTQVLRPVHVAFVLFLCFLVFPVAKRFRHRIMFPIRDSRGRTIGFGGRILDQGAARPYFGGQIRYDHPVRCGDPAMPESFLGQLVYPFRAGREDLDLPPALIKRLKALGAKHGASYFTVLIAGFELDPDWFEQARWDSRHGTPGDHEA